MAEPIIIEDEVVQRALTQDKVCARIMAKQLRPKVGDLVGVRLNLNIFRSLKLPIQTLHQGSRSGNHRHGHGLFNGAVLWYQKVVVLRDAYFNVNQDGREKIASGAEYKFPMASVDGIMMDATNPSFDGIEVRFDPRIMHLFVGPDNRAIRWAEEVTVYAHRAYCRGSIIYHSEATAPPKAGPSPSIAILQPDSQSLHPGDGCQILIQAASN